MYSIRWVRANGNSKNSSFFPKDFVCTHEQLSMSSGGRINTVKKCPEVSIIILNWNGWKDTIECLESLYQITYSNYDVIVVDNGSKDESIEKIKEWADGNIRVRSKFFEYDPTNKPIKYIEYHRGIAITGGGKEKGIQVLPSNRKMIIIRNEKNYGFAKGNNIGMRYALKALNPDYVLILNNDTVVDKEFLKPGTELMEEKKNVGIVTGKIYHYDNAQRIWAAGGCISMHTGDGGGIGHDQIDNGQFNEIKEIHYAPGAMMLVRRSILEQVGFLPECYFATGEEMEFAIKTSKKGYKIVCNPNSVIFHKVGMGSNRSLKYQYNSWRTKLLFMERNLPNTTWKTWSVLYKLMVYLRIKISRKDHKELECFLLALKDHKNKKCITEEDLNKVDTYFKKKQE